MDAIFNDKDEIAPGQHAERGRRAARLPRRPRRRGARPLPRAAASTCSRRRPLPAARSRAGRDARRVPGARRRDGLERRPRDDGVRALSANPLVRQVELAERALRRARGGAPPAPARPAARRPRGRAWPRSCSASTAATRRPSRSSSRRTAPSSGPGAAAAATSTTRASPELGARRDRARRDGRARRPPAPRATTLAAAGVQPRRRRLARGLRRCCARELRERLGLARRARDRQRRGRRAALRHRRLGRGRGGDRHLRARSPDATPAATSSISGSGPTSTGAFALGSEALAAVLAAHARPRPGDVAARAARSSAGAAPTRRSSCTRSRAIGGLPASERGRVRRRRARRGGGGRRGRAARSCATVGAALGDYARVCAARTGQLGAPFPLVLCGGVIRHHPSQLLRATSIRDRVPDGAAGLPRRRAGRRARC